MTYKLNASGSSHTHTGLGYLDLVRFSALCLVMYAHLVLCSSQLLSIPEIYYTGVHPLLPPNSFDKFDLFLIDVFSIGSAPLGVVLFFIATGYLIPLMLEKYTRVEFLINRFFRIYPTYIACTLIAASFLLLLTETNFSFRDILGGILFQRFIVGGVLWTLLIEIKFYLFCAFIGKMTLTKLIVTQISCIPVFCAMKLMSLKGGGGIGLLFFIKFLPAILLGCVMFVTDRMKSANLVTKLGLYVFSLTFCCVFQFQTKNIAMGGLYCYPGLYIIAFIFVMICRVLCRRRQRIKFIADMVYPCYLLHVVVGLSVVSQCARKFNTASVTLLFCIIVVLFLSLVVHVWCEKPSIKVGRYLLTKLRLFFLKTTSD